MIHTPKVSFACHRECSFDKRTYIQQRKERYTSAIFVKLFLLSFFVPMVPPINSLSLDPSKTTRVYGEEKHGHRETTRDSIKPRLKREEYHALSLSLEMCTRAEKERDTQTTRENTKRTSRHNRGFFPNNECAFLYIKNVSVCSNRKRKQKTKQKTKETGKSSILSRLCL